MPAPTTFQLPEVDLLGRVEPRIEAASIPAADRAFLLERLARLKSEVISLDYPLSPGPIHGDAHTGNLVVHAGRSILIDFEYFAWGQPELDLAGLATQYRTAGWLTDTEYETFVQTYGYDITAWKEGFETLQAIHELLMTTWLMQNVTESVDVANEYQIRMCTLRGDRSSRWHPF